MSDNLSAIPETPLSTIAEVMMRASGGVKPAGPELIMFEESAIPVEAMSSLIFENIGGHEMINMLRHDTVDGKNVSYKLVSNTSDIAKAYSPTNIVPTSGSLAEYFKNFAIRLDIHQPDTKSVNNIDNIYIDKIVDPGSLVIEVASMEVNEQIEVQVLQSGTYLDGII